MKDNLGEITEKFGLELSEKFAGGSMWRCKRCGQLACCIENWLPCQTNFVPERIWCMECHSRWSLKLELTDEDKAKLGKAN